MRFIFTWSRQEEDVLNDVITFLPIVTSMTNPTERKE
jgi:hypothetical protein